MRTAGLIVIAAIATACTPEPELNIEHLSTMENRTRGVVLMDDGQKGHGAMGSTTCQFDTLNGWIISDHDMPTSAEIVTDTLNGSVLGVSSEGAHRVMRDAGDVAVQGVHTARFLRGGDLVLMRSVSAGCSVEWNDGTTQVVDQAVCEAPQAGIGVERSTGAVFATADGEVVRIDKAGMEWMSELADFVVYDRTTGLVYLAQQGERTVRAIEADGSPAWSTRLSGPIEGMQWMGSRGKVVAMVQNGDAGQLVVIDGPSGDIELEHPTPESDVELSTSDDGSTLAVVTEREVFFFDVFSVGQEPKQRKTFGAQERQPVFED